MRAARIVSLFFSFFVFFFLIFPKTSFAQNYYQPQTGGYNVPNTNPDVPRNLHTYSQNVVIELMSSLTCLVAGFDPISVNQKCLGYDANTGRIGYSEKNGGLIGISGNLVAMTFIPPIRTGDYVNYLTGNFGIVKKTYAANQTATQGVGFEGIKPLLNIWVIFRNIVYLLFVFVFIIIGVAIMFRVKIDPRTVMTIQNQIPRVIVALVLVTFSFAIAGVLIDLMWIFCFLILNLFSASDPGIDPKLNFDAANAAKNMMDTPFGFLNGIHVGWTTIPADIAGAVADMVKNFFTLDSSLPWYSSIVNFITAPIRSVFGYIAGIAAFLIIAITITIALFRLWFSLIQAYVMIILDIIIGPFWIMSGVIPGRSGGFGSWLKEILANLAVFPAVIFIFVIASRVISAYDSSSATSAFVPPLIGVGITDGGIKGIIAFGLIMATPNLINMIKAAIKAPKIDTSSIMRGVGGAVGVVQKPSSVGWKRLTRPEDLWSSRPEGILRRPLLGPARKLNEKGEVWDQEKKEFIKKPFYSGWRRKIFPTYGKR